MTYASESGPAPPAGFSAGSAASRSASASTASTSLPSRAGTDPRRAACTSTSGTALSSSMYASRSAGRPGSSGTYAPPAFSTARSETTISRLRSISTPTRTSGPTPRPRRWWARRLARAFSSA